MSTGRTTRKSLIKKVNRSRTRSATTKKTGRSSSRKRSEEETPTTVDANAVPDVMEKNESSLEAANTEEVRNESATATTEKSVISQTPKEAVHAVIKATESEAKGPILSKEEKADDDATGSTDAKGPTNSNLRESEQANKNKLNIDSTKDTSKEKPKESSRNQKAYSVRSTDSNQSSGAAASSDRYSKSNSHHNTKNANSAKYKSVPADKFLSGFKKSRHQINQLIDDIVGSMKSKIFITELELSLSFSANGEFLGFGDDGDAVIRIKIDPSVA